MDLRLSSFSFPAGRNASVMPLALLPIVKAGARRISVVPGGSLEEPAAKK